MAGTEFFAALRLVVHASNGTMTAQEVDRGMAFVQGMSSSSFVSASPSLLRTNAFHLCLDEVSRDPLLVHVHQVAG